MAPRTKIVKIPEWAEPILRNAECEGRLMRIPEQLERGDYDAVNKILKALGGKWDRKQQTHVFPRDARQLLDEALAAGGALDKKKTYEQFDTPRDLAEHILEELWIDHDDEVLEPSAGNGNLLEVLLEFGPESVVAIELDPERCAALREKYPDPDISGVTIIEADFLAIAEAAYRPLAGEDGAMRQFDVVVMNPPFSNGQDVKHIMAAWPLLRIANGRLAAIASPHAFVANDALSQNFRDWLDSIGAEVEDLPEGTFTDSGTEIPAKLIRAWTWKAAELVDQRRRQQERSQDERAWQDYVEASAAEFERATTATQLLFDLRRKD